MDEQWKDVKDFEGIYQVSSMGRLKSFKDLKEGRILSNKNKKGGYFSIVLQSGEKKRYVRMHRLVAEAFISNPDNKPEVNHKDSNKQNNCVNNLEWVTFKENVIHAIRHNPNIIRGMNAYNKITRPKDIQQYTLTGELINEFSSALDAGRNTGICHRNILQVANQDEYKPGKTRKQAGGYLWKFKEDSGEYIVNY